MSGAIFGALFIQFVPNWAQDISKAAPWAIYGVFLIGFMYAMPRGIAGSCAWPPSAGSRRRAEPRAVVRRFPEVRLVPLAVPPTHRRVKEDTMRKGFRLALLTVLGLAVTLGPAGRADARRHRDRDQDRQHQPLQRPGLRVRHHRQGARRLLQEGQRRGRRQRPQDQLHHLRRRLQPAQGRRDGPQAGRAGPGGRAVPDARHADQHRHPQVREPAEGAAPVRGHRRHQVERPEELPVDDGLAAELPDRGADLRGSTS